MNRATRIKRANLVEIKTCRDWKWADNAFFQAFLYKMALPQCHTSLHLFNPCRMEHILYKTKPVCAGGSMFPFATLRNKMEREIFLWNINCFLAKSPLPSTFRRKKIAIDMTYSFSSVKDHLVVRETVVLEFFTECHLRILHTVWHHPFALPTTFPLEEVLLSEEDRFYSHLPSGTGWASFVYPRWKEWVHKLDEAVEPLAMGTELEEVEMDNVLHGQVNFTPFGSSSQFDFPSNGTRLSDPQPFSLFLEPFTPLESETPLTEEFHDKIKNLNSIDPFVILCLWSIWKNVE